MSCAFDQVITEVEARLKTTSTQYTNLYPVLDELWEIFKSVVTYLPNDLINYLLNT